MAAFAGSTSTSSPSAASTSYTPRPILSPLHSGLSSPPSSSLPLPSSIRQNRSFARLAQLLGLGKIAPAPRDDVPPLHSGPGSGSGSGSASDDEDEDEDEDDNPDGEAGEEGVDEESLMWDAQTALIAHQPALAVQHYTLAALPPYRSSAACLALGNLLTRGSGLAPPPSNVDPAPATSSPISAFPADVKGKGKARAYSFGPEHVLATSPPLSTPRALPPIHTGARRESTRTIDSSSTLSPTSATPPPSAVVRFMRFIWPVSPPSATPTSALAGATSPGTQTQERMYVDLVGTGWAIPTDGKRAVRDVEGMGVAGGWFVLGLGWIVDGQNISSPLASATAAPQSTSLRAGGPSQPVRGPAEGKGTLEPIALTEFVSAGDGTYVPAQLYRPSAEDESHANGGETGDADDGLVVTRPKTKTPRRSPYIVPTEQAAPPTLAASEAADASESVRQPAQRRDSVPGSSAATTSTETSSDGTILQTPQDESEDSRGRGSGGDGRGHQGQESDRVDPSDEETVKLMYDLLQPLLRLYRNGHIQASDPVYLPPISFTQLPTCLRPQGDAEKGRNVWYLGQQVARQLLSLPLICNTAAPGEHALDGRSRNKALERRRRGVEIMAQYILGMTATGSPAQAEAHFRRIISIGHTNLEYPDEIIRQAAERLDIICRTPTDTPISPIASGEYPFPRISKSKSAAGMDVLRVPRRAVSTPQKRIHPRADKENDTAGRKAVESASMARKISPVKSGSPVAHRAQISISSIKSTASNRLWHESLKSSASAASLSGLLEVQENRPLNPAGSVQPVRSVSHGAERDTAVRCLIRAKELDAAERTRLQRAAEGERLGIEVDSASAGSDSGDDNGSLGKGMKQGGGKGTTTKTRGPASAGAVSPKEDAWWPSIGGWSYAKAQAKVSPPVSPTTSISQTLGPASPPITNASINVLAASQSPVDTTPSTSPRLLAGIPTIRTVASTPTFGSLRHSSSATSTSPLHSTSPGVNHARPRLPTSSSSATLTPRPFDGAHADINTTIDPALAAAEAASALTKHVQCSVCGAEGMNFPGCRKCGLVFCSRACRVGTAAPAAPAVSGESGGEGTVVGRKGAGDGKRHICGVWKGFLTVPSTPQKAGRAAAAAARAGGAGGAGAAGGAGGKGATSGGRRGSINLVGKGVGVAGMREKEREMEKERQGRIVEEGLGAHPVISAC